MAMVRRIGKGKEVVKIVVTRAGNEIIFGEMEVIFDLIEERFRHGAVVEKAGGQTDIAFLESRFDFLYEVAGEFVFDAQVSIAGELDAVSPFEGFIQ